MGNMKMFLAGFWLNRPNRFLAEGRSGFSGITWGWRGEEFDQVWRVVRCQR